MRNFQNQIFNTEGDFKMNFFFAAMLHPFHSADTISVLSPFVTCVDNWNCCSDWSEIDMHWGTQFAANIDKYHCAKLGILRSLCSASLLMSCNNDVPMEIASLYINMSPICTATDAKSFDILLLRYIFANCCLSCW
jgi:hypothetical protein